MGRFRREFEPWRRLHTSEPPRKPPPVAPWWGGEGGSGPDSNNALSAAPMAWERSRAVGAASTVLDLDQNGPVEVGMAAGAGARLHTFIEWIDEVLLTCSGGASSTNLLGRCRLYDAENYGFH